VDVRQLRHFVTVADTLHFGRAAERLGMTQPPLSQSILALERELGAALFERTKRSVALTAFGAQWRPYVEAALGAVAGLGETAARLQAGTVGHLDLNFVSTADYSVLPDLVRRFAGGFPDVEIRLTEATSDVQIATLLAGEGDAGLIISPPGAPLPDRLSSLPLLQERLVAAVPENWIGDGRLGLEQGRLTARTAIAAPLIIFPRRVAPAFHDLVTGYHLHHGGRAAIVQEAIQMQTIISLVSAGMGIALVPASLRNLARTGVAYLDLLGEVPILETALIWRSGDATPTLDRFLAIARAMATSSEVSGPWPAT
jgi:DNA-binding transcriptional LysR family regulator